MNIPVTIYERHKEKAKSIVLSTDLAIADMNHDSEQRLTLAQQKELVTRISQALAEFENSGYENAEKFYGYR